MPAGRSDGRVVRYVAGLEAIGIPVKLPRASWPARRFPVESRPARAVWAASPWDTLGGMVS